MSTSQHEPVSLKHDASQMSEDAPPKKRTKLSDDCIVISDQSDSDTDCAPSCADPPMFYLTKVRGISDEYNQPNYTVDIKGMASRL